MMNIIEKLGGYESAKDVWGWNEDGWSYWNPKTKRYAHSTNDSEYLNIDELEDDLLKYRRENNIFDVGDKIIFLAMGNTVMHYDECLSMFLSQGLIQHATDAEIEVGRRL